MFAKNVKCHLTPKENIKDIVQKIVGAWRGQNTTKKILKRKTTKGMTKHVLFVGRSLKQLLTIKNIAQINAMINILGSDTKKKKKLKTLMFFKETISDVNIAENHQRTGRL